MKKTHFFVRHRVAAFAIAVLTVVIGWVSLKTLPVEQYPDIAPPKAYDFRTNISGNPGVMFYVKQAPGANATKVNEEIRKVLADVKKRLPAGLEFKLLETSDDFLYASMYNVVETLVIAILLVVFVVYFFLQDFKATIIPSISILVSLIGTFAVVSIAGFSLNLLTLFALVLAIGTVVDDAIVVVEAVMTKIESQQNGDGTPGMQGEHNMNQAVTEACRDRLRPIIMTVFAMTMGMVPLALGNGAGAVGNKSLALAVIGGMIVGTAALLFITPAFYMVFQTLHEKLTPVKYESEKE